MNIYKLPNHNDITIIGRYASHIINTCPVDVIDIKIDGDILFLYHREHPGDYDGSSLSYENYNIFANEIRDNIINNKNHLSDESRVRNEALNIFGEFYDLKFYSNYIYTDYGSIIVDLERFTNLENFYMYRIFTKTIKNVPQTVKTFYCNSCQLKALPKMPKSLETLNCSGNRIRSLPRLQFTKLRNLYVISNWLKKISKLPVTIEKLYCYADSYLKFGLLNFFSSSKIL
jgi:hypothetical protein